MKTTTLVICHIESGDSFLFRKKPDGSPPYKETWYEFGAELNTADQSPDQIIVNSVKQQTGVDIEIIKHLWWDTETKPDNNGEMTFFIYLHIVGKYLNGELKPGPGIEKLAWIKIIDLNKYDIVPPSKKFLTKYLTETKRN